MAAVPNDLLYTEHHQWILKISDLLIVGITETGQEELSDILFVELPRVGRIYQAGEPCGRLESIRVEEDLYTPVTGRVIEVNEELEKTPELINESPYDEGWVFKMSPLDASEMAGLLSSKEYEKQIE